MICTTAQVWSALPYVAREALLTIIDPSDSGIDTDVLDSRRIQVTPWALLPVEIKERLYDSTTCGVME
jgi:hypothetical protein